MRRWRADPENKGHERALEKLRRWARQGTVPQEMYEASPVLAFAAIGQGRADGRITPEEESAILGKLLTHWALKSTLQALAGCAARPVRRPAGQVAV